MYEVFSMTRAGRPRWALVATAVLFLLTTLLALFISGRKAKQAEIILGETKPYRALSLQAGFPSGWDVSPAEKVGGGYVVLASSPQQDRHLFVFRMRASAVSGRFGRRVALDRAVKAVVPQAQFVQPEPEGMGRVGTLDSETYRLALFSPALGPGLQMGLANVAVTPDRQILGILLVAADMITNRDRRLIQTFSQGVSYDSETSPVEPEDGLEAPIDDVEEDGDALQPVARVESSQARPLATPIAAVGAEFLPSRRFLEP